MRRLVPRRRSLILGTLALAAVPAEGCWALLVKGRPARNPRSKEVMWGFVVLDLLLGFWILIGYIPIVPIGLIIDFATGAIYRPINEVRRRNTLDDLEDEDEDEDDEDEDEDDERSSADARDPWSPAGQEAVLLALCPQADELLHGLEPGHLRRWARAFRAHVEVCPTCASALVGAGVHVRIPRHLTGAPELVGERLEAAPAELPELTPEDLARLAEATDAVLRVIG